jgi:hypothetical protein
MTFSSSALPGLVQILLIVCGFGIFGSSYLIFLAALKPSSTGIVPSRMIRSGFSRKRFLNGLFSISRFPASLQIVARLQYAAHTFSDYRVIIGKETQQLRGFVRLHFNLLRVEGDGALRQLASHRWRRAIRESIVSR